MFVLKIFLQGQKFSNSESKLFNDSALSKNFDDSSYTFFYKHLVNLDEEIWLCF